MSKEKTNQGVEILCVGTELLLGTILNSNAKWIAEKLALLGVNHYRQSVIGDNHERLKSIICEASNRSRVVITTGGLGPTPDDLTTEAIASAFNSKLFFRQEIWEDIKNKFKSNLVIPNNNKKQAEFPLGAHIIPNQLGTAPGMIWTPKENFTVITFPGVPSEMKKMWEQTIKAWFHKNYPSGNIFISKTMKFTGISESSLVQKIPDLLEKKNPTVAPYASLGEVKLRITAKSKSIKEANHLIAPFENEIQKRCGFYFFGNDEQTLPSIIIDLLRKRRETLSVAESCTGGGLAAALTAIPGSSDVFLGGVIAYNNSIKQRVLEVPFELIDKHGAVSEAVARAMAKGVRKIFQSDWAISITGIAGPTGNTLTKKIGLVELCLEGHNFNKSIQENFHSHKVRSDIQKLSVLKALDKLRLSLLNSS